MTRRLERHATGSQGAFNRPAQPGNQIISGIVRVIKNIRHGIPGHDVVQMVIAVGAYENVHRVCIPEQVMQVTENLLVGADQKETQVVILPCGGVQADHLLHVAPVDKLVDFYRPNRR